jgi:hypothetical protein
MQVVKFVCRESLTKWRSLQASGALFQGGQAILNSEPDQTGEVMQI